MSLKKGSIGFVDNSNRFEPTLPGFTGFDEVLLGFSGFYLV